MCCQQFSTIYRQSFLGKFFCLPSFLKQFFCPTHRKFGHPWSNVYLLIDHKYYSVPNKKLYAWDSNGFDPIPTIALNSLLNSLNIMHSVKVEKFKKVLSLFKIFWVKLKKFFHRKSNNPAGRRTQGGFHENFVSFNTTTRMIKPVGWGQKNARQCFFMRPLNFFEVVFIGKHHW